ncbi:flavin reductase family protein [Siminovitchia sp. 179-K 8D1 HS]|uniref:flavin reductase family protein n=1 Tax=Siminovitchia sp. 179-K 8D1 HS TaxID=3142385 RepID=UPI0039A118AF
MIKTYKEIMGSYPTGVSIVTTMDDDKPVGLTVNSFASVSLDPLLVSWCIDKKSSSIEAFNKSDRFAVNILSGHQKEECFIFADSKESDRFSKTSWERSSNDLPILKNVFAVLECKKVQEIDAGDHILLIGEVIHLQKNDHKPMFYYQRNVSVVPG